MLDTDKSGRLDRDEFMAMMEMENDHQVEGEMANMTSTDIGDLLANSIGDMMTAGTAGADEAAMTAPDIGDLLANSIGDMMTAGTAGADEAAAMAAADAAMAKE